MASKKLLGAILGTFAFGAMTVPAQAEDAPPKSEKGKKGGKKGGDKSCGGDKGCGGDKKGGDKSCGGGGN